MAIDHTSPPDVQRFCDPYCYPPLNPAGICPVFCVIICLNACKTIIPQITLPPDVSSPPPPPPWSRPPDLHYKLSLALIIVASIIATAFFFLTCYTLYKLYSCWRRRPARVRVTSRRYDSDRTHFEDLGPVIDNPIWYIRTVGLQPSVINSIPVVKYSKLDGLIDGTDCSVCLTEFEEDETLRLLPKCNHAFHLPCIDTWLRSHTNCPLCRAAVIDTDTALIPSEEVIVHNSSMVESNPVETEGSELRLGIDEHQIGMDPVRRSVSMDALSASRVCNRVLGDEKEQDQSFGIVVSKRVVINQSLLRLVGSSSVQTGSSCSSVKRSVSCSAKVFQERN